MTTSAVYNERKVEVIEKVIQEESITLTLTMEQAEMIRSFTGFVNLREGDAKETLTPVWEALGKVLPGYNKYRPGKVEFDTLVLHRRSSR